MKSKFLRFLSWLADLLSSIFSKQADEQDAKDDSKKIDKSDDHIKDNPVNPKDRKDDDAFDNKNW